jgi:hypothetical protein
MGEAPSEGPVHAVNRRPECGGSEEGRAAARRGMQGVRGVSMPDSGARWSIETEGTGKFKDRTDWVPSLDPCAASFTSAS